MRFIFSSIFGFIMILIFPEKKRKKTEKPETRHSYIIYRLALNISFFLGFLFWMINALCVSRKGQSTRGYQTPKKERWLQVICLGVIFATFPKCPLLSLLHKQAFLLSEQCSVYLWQNRKRQLFRRSCFMVLQLELLLASSWIVGGQKMLYVLFAVVLCKWFGS